jgi:hypothetical protein
VNRTGIIPGHVKKDPCSGTDRFYQLYSVRKAEIEFSDGSKVVKEFRREPEMQYIDGADHETTTLRIEILDTYPPGDKPGGSSFDYEDTGTFGKAAISEIKVEQS